MKTHRRRKVWIGLALLALALVALRLALPGIVKDFVNNKLDELDGYDGHVEDVDIYLIRGAYAINGVEIVKVEDDIPAPFFEARKVDFSVQWKELFHGAIVSEIDVYRGRINFVKGPTEDTTQTGPTNDWIQVVEDLFPFKINRFTVHEGELWYRDFHADPQVNIAITNMSAVATNLTNSRDLEELLPAAIKVNGESIGGGDLQLHVKLNPLAYEPTFDMALKLTNVHLPAFNDFFRAYAKVDVEEGSMDLLAEMAAAEGKFKGYVKPLMQDINMLEFSEDNENPLKLAWEAVVAGVVQLFKNQPKDQFATVVPFEGDFDAPNVETWETIRNVLKNAFVRAFRPRFEDAIGINIGSSDDKGEKKKKDD